MLVIDGPKLAQKQRPIRLLQQPQPELKPWLPLRVQRSLFGVICLLSLAGLVGTTAAVQPQAPDAQGGHVYIEVINNQASLSASTFPVVYVTAPSLSLRTEPSISAKIITTIPAGTALSVERNSNGWLEVNYAGQDGYVGSGYTRLNP